MDYFAGNKAAWEEAFEKRRAGWGDDNHLRLKKTKFAFFDNDLKAEVESMDFAGKDVAQFCCNNGREVLSLLDGGARSAVGFDIAEGAVAQARETAEKAGITNCDFVACNILDIPESYHGRFDFIFFTIGALIWFDDLAPLFEKTSKCLRPNGLLLINDTHPMLNMLPMPEEAGFDPSDLNRTFHSYFRKDACVENDGMSYMSGKYYSKTFTSFYHTMSDIVNALSVNDMKTVKLSEYDYDVGDVSVYNGKGFPLSFILIAQKSG
ncbi:MAG: class I SAM-dependent methyltransferase [Treponema sp.]|nr:class I SAM-dependent methyltransferase [Treponema sp.]